MNATTNFTVKSLRANKVRTLVTIAGVALAAALLTAVLTTYASLNDFLYRNEAALAGTWMACVEADGSSALDEKIADAQADSQVSGTAIMRDIGFAELTADQQDTQGTYLAIRSIEGDVGDICGIEPSEGRLPENEHEIMLFATWNDYGGVSLGDTVTFNVGQRVARLAPGEEGSMSAGTMTASWGVQGEAHESEITDGAPLNSSMGVLEADIDGGIFNEEVTNTEERTYTVVGFYDRPGYALSTAAGMVGVTAGAAAPDAFTDVFLTLNDVTNTQQVEEAAEALFPDEHVVLHTAMLRYMGVSSDSSIWTTFYGLVVVLAAVIVVACVSLIFNAFNISVAERIKQFGLLSSVGASRRQLRRAVVLEGAIVAVIGIPCGLLIGLAGCAVTFAALGPALAQLAGSVEVPFRVAVNGWVLLVASVLTFVTVLVSVWIPAKRASRTNIIDSLRAASGSRVSRRGAARAAKCTAPSSLWKARGAAGRVLGVGGMLARISRKRGTGKGRAASVSLALAIVLLMTAGSLSVFLGTLTDVVTGGGELAGEVGVMAQLDVETPQGEGTADGDVQAGNDGATGADSAATQPAAPMTPEAVAAANNELFARQAEVFAGAFHDLSQVADAEPVGWKMGTGLYAMLPEAMAGEALVDQENGMGGKMADGRVGTVGSVAYLDDAAFDDYAKSLGLDPPTSAIRLTCGPSLWPKATATTAASTSCSTCCASRARWRPLRRRPITASRRRASASAQRPERAILRPSPSNPTLKAMTTGSNGSLSRRRRCRQSPLRLSPWPRRRLLSPAPAERVCSSSCPSLWRLTRVSAMTPPSSTATSTPPMATTARSPRSWRRPAARTSTTRVPTGWRSTPSTTTSNSATPTR